MVRLGRKDERKMIRYVKPSRARDVVGVVMLALTAFLLWSETSDRVTGAGEEEPVDVVVTMGAAPSGALAHTR
jgi:hypothetical protein